MKSPSILAKLIIAQPLADHDGAAIFAFEVVSFNKQTGVLINKVRIYPDLAEQSDEDNGRTINYTLLSQVIAGQSAQKYLIGRGEAVRALHGIPEILAQELFNPALECEFFFWQMAKSYPVLRHFYVQFTGDDISELFELPNPLDARTFVGPKCIEKLDEETDIYALINQISQKYAPVLKLTQREDISSEGTLG